jgi:hypothetical protein
LLTLAVPPTQLTPQIAPSSAAMDGLSSQFTLKAEPWSLNILTLHLGASPSSIQLSSGSDGSASSAAAA